MLWTVGIKFSLNVETTIFNSQQLFPSCLLIWGIMQERVYNNGKITNVELRQRIVDECLDQRIIDGAVKEWRKRLRERVLLLKEDSLNMNCDSWCNSVVATVHYDFAVNRLTAYNICRDCFQCSLTLSVSCSRCEAL